MALELYRKKRNFKNTPEPQGKVVKREGGDLTFVIQKHAATRLHYDFRLELNGVLLSWAVPKGPSLDPNDKRLAVHVEDHPMEYGGFEGIIPPKQYGSGTVMLWDRGIWIPKEDPVAGYKKGRLKFELRGAKLRGGWILIKSHGGKYDGDKAWLLIKEADEYAHTGPEARVVEGMPDSVVTRRSLEQIAADPERVWHSNKSVEENVRSGAVEKPKTRVDLAELPGARKAPLPAFIPPQLATLVKTAPEGKGWVHEIKYDGYRMLSRVHSGAVEIYSRSRKEWTGAFPAVAQAISGMVVESAWIDGEVIALDEQGRSNFQALQNALSTGGEVNYFVFDLMYLNGYDLREVSLELRKAILQMLVPSAGMIRYSEHFDIAGASFLEEVCKLGLEGIVSKRADSKYEGTRGQSWVKVKCTRRQEMVIGGFTDPEGSRKGFGALLLGVYDADGNLRYSGKVGTGFNHATLTKMRRELERMAQEKPAFINPPRGAEARRAHWVKPELVAEVAFTEWTQDGTLRHPSFLGLRKDKRARDVMREEPAVDPEKTPETSYPQSKKTPKTSKANVRGKNEEDIVAGIKITNPAKVLYPEAGITKRDLALYYEAVGDWIVPHLRDRPLTLVRCPEGWNKECFYQKHAVKGVPEVIERVTVQDSDGPALYMKANTVSAVVAALQMGALELHSWGSRKPNLGFPDRIVFDFDPDEALSWREITEGVNILKTLLDNLGLRGFLKTTGGKGLHVVVPIEPDLPWEKVTGFSRAIAELFERTFPDRFTAKISKATRRGKIYIDYLRNTEGATAVAAYSTRAKPKAPVSTPIDWSELSRDVRFDYFNVKNVPGRLKRLKRDPWQGFMEARQSITKEMMEQIGYRG